MATQCLQCPPTAPRCLLTRGQEPFSARQRFQRFNRPSMLHSSTPHSRTVLSLIPETYPRYFPTMGARLRLVCSGIRSRWVIIAISSVEPHSQCRSASASRGTSVLMAS